MWQGLRLQTPLLIPKEMLKCISLLIGDIEVLMTSLAYEVGSDICLGSGGYQRSWLLPRAPRSSNHSVPASDPEAR